jgi:hypothetical protein
MQNDQNLCQNLVKNLDKFLQLKMNYFKAPNFGPISVLYSTFYRIPKKLAQAQSHTYLLLPIYPNLFVSKTGAYPCGALLVPHSHCAQN